ncbi:hypothetical protein CISIN_1g018400mg [Citrus sinensis]|uniref:WAT1-related protein n=1 Tax=Citrus sinensis TaxID=2711 RepID=A0A067H4S4_CITSI|nr:hypothetical protein CISIN_1g018400mg [Citrus sinensis]
MGVDMGSMRAALPSVGMVIVLLAQVSNMEVIKAAMSKGINKYVIIVYSDALSSLFFLFCSFLFHRSERPQLTFSILCSFFLLSVFGCSSQIFSFVGIQYSSPTLSTAMLNLIPAFTFVLAIIFRLEKLNWENKSSQAKSLGTFASIGGAFVVTFYKGPPLIGELSHSGSPRRLLLSPQLSWILGGFFLAAEAFMNSAWFILQALILRKFAAVLIIMFYLFFFNTILSTAFALIVVSEPSDWKLGLDIGLVAVLYSVSSYWHWVSSWLVHMVPVENWTSLCINVQALGHCLLYCHGCRHCRRRFLSWKFNWSNDNCSRILCSDVGKVQRRKDH